MVKVNKRKGNLPRKLVCTPQNNTVFVFIIIVCCFLTKNLLSVK